MQYFKIESAKTGCYSKAEANNVPQSRFETFCN